MGHSSLSACLYQPLSYPPPLFPPFVPSFIYPSLPLSLSLSRPHRGPGWAPCSEWEMRASTDTCTSGTCWVFRHMSCPSHFEQVKRPSQAQLYCASIFNKALQETLFIMFWFTLLCDYYMSTDGNRDKFTVVVMLMIHYQFVVLFEYQKSDCNDTVCLLLCTTVMKNSIERSAYFCSLHCFANDFFYGV